MIRWDIVFAGVGGQGLLSCGTLTGEAATVECGLNAAMVASYGVETRGTFTKADIIVSSEEIDFPEVEHPSVVICLHEIAYNRYAGKLPKGVTLIYDNTVIEEKPCDSTQFGYPIAKTASDMGAVTSTNILAIGIMCGKLDILPKDKMETVIVRSRPKAAEKNIALFNAGYEMGKA